MAAGGQVHHSDPRLPSDFATRPAGPPLRCGQQPPAPRLHGRGAPILLNTNMFPLDFHSSRGSGLRGQSHRARDENGARKEGDAGRPPALPPRSPLPLHRLGVKSTWPPTSQGWHADLVFAQRRPAWEEDSPVTALVGNPPFTLQPWEASGGQSREGVVGKPFC